MTTKITNITFISLSTQEAQEKYTSWKISKQTKEDFDERFEDERGISAGEAFLFKKRIADEEEGNLFSVLFFDLITVVADLAESDVPLGFKDKISPLHKLTPDIKGMLRPYLLLTGEQFLKLYEENINQIIDNVLAK